MTEEPKRLEPTKETIRELFAKSGNICAFPGCNHLIIDENGDFIAQTCHIEAAMPGGERFNPEMTNEQRRDVSNLMLMCHKHHIKTNNVIEYPTDKMRSIKEEHERKFLNPEDKILKEMNDHTEARTVIRPSNLKKYYNVLGMSEYEVYEKAIPPILETLGEVIDKLELVPSDVLHEFGAILERAYRVRDNKNVIQRDGLTGFSILASDIQGAFRLNDREFYDMANRFSAYELAFGDMGFFKNCEHGQDCLVVPRFIFDWDFWMEIAELCDKTGQSLKQKLQKLDFSFLDE